MTDYLKILRPKNLVIIGVTQYILYTLLITNLVVNPSLDFSLFVLLSIDTMLIAAGGYIINDILDYEADIINKPDKIYFQSDYAKNNAKIYYVLILTLGFCIALFIAIKIHNILLAAIYPAACFLLFAYSYKFKNTVLSGNILVSLFIALVPGIIIFSERHSLAGLNDIVLKKQIIELFFVYMIFSFFVNLIREVVKDLEDMTGDMNSGFITYPIRYGIYKTVKLLLQITVLTILLVVVWLFSSSISMDFRILSYFVLFTIMPLFVICQMLIKSHTKKDFSTISSLLKWVMLMGLAGLIIITSNLH